jgi:hypothetical protein
MPNKEFLEEYPLFRKLEGDVPNALDNLHKIPINMDCRNCGSLQTFNMINNYYDDFQYSNPSSNDTKIRLIYKCQSCREFTRVFMIYISQDLDYIYKFGQYPEWEIKMDKVIEKMLGEHAKTFRKGLVCESQGYGIGAFSYYRRITEEIIDDLLDSIEDLIEDEHKAEYKDALEKTKKTRVTKDKIDLIKDLLPPILKPNGTNPLGVLHSELSAGMHAESDQECLENANHVKKILVFLINQITRTQEAALEFTTSMKTLLDKKKK